MNREETLLAPLESHGDALARLSESYGERTVVVNRPSVTEGRTGILEVIVHGPQGDTTYRTRMRYTPEPVTAAFRDSVFAARTASYRARLSPGEMRDVERVVESVLAWPEFHPPVSSLRLGSDGSPWLLRAATSDSQRWIVLNPDGTPRGTLALPPRTRVEWSDGDRFWAVELDDFDVPWLARYRFTN